MLAEPVPSLQWERFTQWPDGNLKSVSARPVPLVPPFEEFSKTSICSNRYKSSADLASMSYKGSGYLYRGTAQCNSLVWGSLRLAPIIVIVHTSSIKKVLPNTTRPRVDHTLEGMVPSWGYKLNLASDSLPPLYRPILGRNATSGSEDEEDKGWPRAYEAIMICSMFSSPFEGFSAAGMPCQLLDSTEHFVVYNFWENLCPKPLLASLNMCVLFYSILCTPIV